MYEHTFTRSVSDGFAAGRHQKATGLLAEQVRCGALVDGQRVIGMRRGVQGGTGRKFVTVQLADRSWSGRLYFGERVAGTKCRTDFPAGPVGAGRGAKATRTGGGDDLVDRHARFIDGIVYAA